MTLTAAPVRPTTDADHDAQAQAALDAETARLVSGLKKTPEDPRDDLRYRAELIAEACGLDTWGDPIATPQDVLSWIARIVAEGYRIPRLGVAEVRNLRHLKIVPNARLRDEYERRVAAGDTGLLIHLARALRGDKRDTTYVRRLLGLEPRDGGRNSGPTLVLFIPYERAVALADALDLPYHHLGL